MGQREEKLRKKKNSGSNGLKGRKTEQKKEFRQ